MTSALYVLATGAGKLFHQDKSRVIRTDESGARYKLGRCARMSCGSFL
jgi:hypothetical protein